MRFDGIAAGIVAASTACNPPHGMRADASTDASTTWGATTSSFGASSDVAPPTGPPSILDLGASALTMTEGDVITVTAVVRDPDGEDDVTGGSLRSADEAWDYGAFERDRAGRWTLELSWDALHVDPQLGFSGTTEVTVLARFVDSTMASTEATLPLRLTCPGIAGADCGGACVDLDADAENCGACGHCCDTVTLLGDDAVGGCLQQACLPIWSPCMSADAVADCAEACASIDSQCVLGACANGTYRTYADMAQCRAGGPGTPAVIDSCAPRPDDPWDAGSAVRCCCATM